MTMLILGNKLLKKLHTVPLRKKLQNKMNYHGKREKFLEKRKIHYQGKIGYKEKLKEMSKTKYRKNKSHRDRVKVMSTTKYCKNKSHRDRVKVMSTTKYCSVLPCQWLDTARGQLWICFTCHGKISRGTMPPESALNNLATSFIPPALACLNSLEQHLIALHIPFMKLLALPKGGQNGVHGPVTCVPANIVQTSNLLPCSDMDESLMPVKLKRKLTYKGHYEYQYVDSMRIK